MPYQISGTNSAGATGRQAQTIEEARQIARELAASGFRDVKIKDERGNEVR